MHKENTIFYTTYRNYKLKIHIGAFRAAFYSKNLRHPTIKELCEEFEKSPKDIQEALLDDVSLNNLENNDPEDPREYIDMISYDDWVFKDQETLSEFELLFKNIDKLDPKDKLVLSMRYGLCWYDEHTLVEMAKIMWMSTEYIRKIEINAIKMLKHFYNKKN